MNIIDEFEARGAIHQQTDPGLGEVLAAEPMTFYVGFDPTAASLHVGSLLPLMIVRRLQRAGHRPLLLIGGATGMIGDPSGKSQERQLLDHDTIEANVRGVRSTFERLLDFDGPAGVRIVNNADWYVGRSMLDFLRDVGKHFTVNHMLSKESVRSRINSEGGISFTEFSYMLLQAYDFEYLHRTEGCRLQVGGSDQWGNITAGCELIRRTAAARGQPTPKVYGFTHPLVTKSDGTKFGKSESGTVWLDADRTSPYELYQFFVRTPDTDVITYLKFFTELSHDELAQLADAVANQPERREAQTTLAQAVVTLIHGADELARVEVAAQALYGGDISGLDANSLQQVFADAPATTIARARLDDGIALVDLLAETGLCKSKSAARRDLNSGGVYVNNNRVSGVDTTIGSEQLVGERFTVLRRGKKSYHLVKFE